LADEPYGGSDPNAEDCIRAGLYWFSRRDMEAARAWWERAILLDPDNAKAHECLRLLQSFEKKLSSMSTMVTEPELTPVKKPKPQPIKEDFELELEPDPPPPEEVKLDVHVAPAPAIDPLFDRASPEEKSKDLGSLDLDNREWSEAMRSEDETGPAPIPMASLFITEDNAWSGETPETLPGERGVWPPIPEDLEIETLVPSEDLVAPMIPPLSSDPLEFASASDPSMVSSADGDVGPWDEGPSRTSAVTIDDQSQEFDAIAEQTPLPDVDKDFFFGRVQDDGALLDYMRSTGDLLVRRAPTMDVPETTPAPSDWEGAVSAEIVFEDAIEMSAQAQPRRERRRTPDELLEDARDRMSLHDFQGVLDLVEQIPVLQRNDEANQLRAQCRGNLLKMYESKIGPTDRVPTVKLSSEEIIWLNLNHRAGFILSQIDGSVTYEDLIALSGMDRLDTVRILAELISQKVIR
jgi:hypothetical protein